MVDLTTELLGASLAANRLETRVIANNMANLDTPGFVPQTVRFATQMRQALAAGQSPLTVKPQVVADGGAALRNDQNGVSLDGQMVALAKNSMEGNLLASELKDRYARLTYTITGAGQP